MNRNKNPIALPSSFGMSGAEILYRMRLALRCKPWGSKAGKYLHTFLVPPPARRLHPSALKCSGRQSRPCAVLRSAANLRRKSGAARKGRFEIWLMDAVSGLCPQGSIGASVISLAPIFYKIRACPAIYWSAYPRNTVWVKSWDITGKAAQRFLTDKQI